MDCGLWPPCLWRAVTTRVFSVKAQRRGPITTLTGLGMTLFFVLSGFVIHYNYCRTIPKAGGVRAFAVARFARLYPLYIALFIVDFSYTGLFERGACGRAGEAGHSLALANYLTLTQSWYYAVICKSPLIYQYGPVAVVTWSISVEAFLLCRICRHREVDRARTMAGATRDRLFRCKLSCRRRVSVWLRASSARD